MFGNMGTIWSELGLDSTRFNQGMQLAESRVALAGRKMQSFGRTLTMGVSLPLMAVGIAATKAGMDFDSGMTKSLAIMNNVSPQIRRQMEQTAKSIVDYTTFSAKEGADAYFYLASAGLDAAQSIEALPRVARFAQAGNFDLARATDLLTDAQSALGLTMRDDVIENMKNMVRVSDVLVKANTLSNATVEQFSESLTNKAGAALKLLNKDIEEGVAVLAAWADQGVKGSEAGNYLNIVLRDLQRSAINNEEVFDQFNISVFDSTGKVRNMADVIGDLETALSGMSDKEKRATLMMLGFQDRSISAMMSLLGTSDAIRTYEGSLRSATGFTENVAAKQMESFTAQVEQLKNELINVGISIFDVLRPNLEDLLKQVKKAIDWFDNLTEGQKKLAVNMGLVLIVLGPALSIFGKLTVVIPQVTKGVIGLNVASKGLLATWGPLALAVVAGGWAIYRTSQEIYDAEQKAEDLESALTHLERAFGGLSIKNKEQREETQKLIERVKELTQQYPELADKVVEITNRYYEGINTKKENIDLMKKEIEALVDTAKKTEYFTKAVEGHTKAQNKTEGAIGDTTEAMDDQEEAADDLTDSIDDLIGSLFKLYNLNQSVTETTWDYEDALDNLDKVMGDVNSTEREKQKAIYDTQDAMENLISSIWEEYNAEGTSIKRKQELVKQMDGVIGKAHDMGIKLDEVSKDRLINIDADVSGAMVEIGKVIAEIAKVKSKSVTISTNYESIYGRTGGKEGGYVTSQGIQRFATGGLPHAAPGWVTPPYDGGGIPAIVHKNEVILNSQQQAKLLFEIAKGNKTIEGGKTGDIHLHMEYNEELASQTFATLFAQKIGEIS